MTVEQSASIKLEQLAGAVNTAWREQYGGEPTDDLQGLINRVKMIASDRKCQTDNLRVTNTAYVKADARIRALTEELSAANLQVLDLVARMTFIKGADIPRTIEGARAALVLRVRELEAQLAAIADFDTESRSLAEERDFRALEALLQGRIECSDDLPEAERPVSLHARLLFGHIHRLRAAALDVVRTRTEDFGGPEAERHYRALDALRELTSRVDRK